MRVSRDEAKELGSGGMMKSARGHLWALGLFIAMCLPIYLLPLLIYLPTHLPVIPNYHLPTYLFTCHLYLSTHLPVISAYHLPTIFPLTHPPTMNMSFAGEMRSHLDLRWWDGLLVGAGLAETGGSGPEVIRAPQRQSWPC